MQTSKGENRVKGGGTILCFKFWLLQLWSGHHLALVGKAETQ